MNEYVTQNVLAFTVRSSKAGHLGYFHYFIVLYNTTTNSLLFKENLLLVIF